MKWKRIAAFASAVIAAAGAARAAGFPVTAEKAIPIDLDFAGRTGETMTALTNMTYSGTGWVSSKGGSATVLAQRQGASTVFAPVKAKAGEGVFAFTPTSAGVWTFTHTDDDGNVSTATFTVTGESIADDIVSMAEGTLALDLRGGTRELGEGESATGLTYSGTGWQAATGGSATVKARLDGASYDVSVLNGKAGEGTFAFAPLSGGVWTLTHTDADGNSVTAKFSAPVAEQGGGESGGETGYELVLVDAATAPVALDLRGGTRSIETSDELWPITYSGSGWELPVSGSVTIGYTPNGGETRSETQRGEGTTTFRPDVAGLWTLTHTLADGDTLTATFDLSEDALWGTLANPWPVETDEELAEKAADGVYVTTLSNLNPPAGFALVWVGGNVYQVVAQEWTGTGTEADPFIVDSAAALQRVLDKAASDGMSDVWVKLDGDITGAVTVPEGIGNLHVDLNGYMLCPSEVYALGVAGETQLVLTGEVQALALAGDGVATLSVGEYEVAVVLDGDVTLVDELGEGVSVAAVEDRTLILVPGAGYQASGDVEMEDDSYLYGDQADIDRISQIVEPVVIEGTLKIKAKKQ